MTPLQHNHGQATGSIRPSTDAHDESNLYWIENVDALPPFLVTVTNDDDLWMYVSSSGALTCGRVRAENCIFPYETDDRLAVSGGLTGPVTIIRVKTPGNTVVWEPFSKNKPDGAKRHLAKSLNGNRLIFREDHHELGLSFQYEWATSAEFGFVRTARIAASDPSKPFSSPVAILDGVVNIMPAGVTLGAQQGFSTLIDALKRNELDPRTSIATYALEAALSDTPEPAESLRANVAWSPTTRKIWISEHAAAEFRAGRLPHDQPISLGTRGAYFVQPDTAKLQGSDASAEWTIVLDAACDAATATRLKTIATAPDAADRVRKTVNASQHRLDALLAAADAQHCSGDPVCDAHHRSNTLFNCMRGGVFAKGLFAPRDDYLAFLESASAPVAARHRDAIARFSPAIHIVALRDFAAKAGDIDLQRLTSAYLPLTFGRRHGDPSRPWNQFTIRVRDDDGADLLFYEGNWRDIFQNWEALCCSFPPFLTGVVAMFLNATSADGYNPYRISRNGIDWEVPPDGHGSDDIGFWGDHQIVYLLRLLELWQRHEPEAMHALLSTEMFTHADIPYNIRPFADRLANPKDTIEFDWAKHKAIIDRQQQYGSDARLMHDGPHPLHVNMLEKLLVPMFAKLGSFVPDGGIWMDTQRPEWNDANNALAGDGLSVVTLCALRSYIVFVRKQITTSGVKTVTLSTPLLEWVRSTGNTLASLAGQSAPLSGIVRLECVRALGTAADKYRAQVRAGTLRSRNETTVKEITGILDAALHAVERSIRGNKRDDGLFHSYNLLVRSADALEVEHMYPMLEGQVVALTTGLLDAAETADLIESLESSPLYRPDQRTFMLYPNRSRPNFLERGVVGPELRAKHACVDQIAAVERNGLFERDEANTVRFAASLSRDRNLREAIEDACTRDQLARLVAPNQATIVDLYETVFDHHAFTGRSGTMHKYEGLGSIYWHMNAKLLIAVQEVVHRAIAAGAPPDDIARAARAYHRVRAGFCFNKTPGEYGAFPVDCYSHTPLHMGAQQPGMTGQVKEMILTRLGELGVGVRDGCLRFEPQLLPRTDLLESETLWTFIDASGSSRSITLGAGSLGFTMAHTPVIYQALPDADRSPHIVVYTTDGATRTLQGAALDAATTNAIFNRDGTVDHIQIFINAAGLFATA